jgi:hypothetical protein
MLRFMTLIVYFMLLCACAPSSPALQPSPSPTPTGESYAPRAGDDALVRSKFFLDKAGTRVAKRDGQFVVDLKGSLPTPCNQPRVVVDAPDAQNRIVLEAYSVIDPNRMCNQMVQPFEGTIALGNLPQGHYTVWVNGEEIGEIDA